MLIQFSAFSTKENMNKWINLEIYCQRVSLRQSARWFIIKFHGVKCFITAVGTELFTASDVWDLVFFCGSHFYFMYCHLGRKSIYVKYCSPLVRPREKQQNAGMSYSTLFTALSNELGHACLHLVQVLF